MRLKVRLESGAQVLSLTTKPDADLTVQDLLDSLKELAPSVSEIRAGYPPKPIDLQSESGVQATLFSVGIKNGEQLVVNTSTGSGSVSQAPPSSHPGTASVASSSTTRNSNKKSEVDNRDPDRLTVPIGNGSYLRLRVMEDDNSCMFRAVGYAFMRSLDSMFELRNIVAEAIRNDPFEYNDAILGRKSTEYINWILQQNSWGGAIELDILSKHFDVTICSLDVSTGRVDHFNPGKGQFIIVIYSGIHYDTVAMSPFVEDQGTDELDTTVFTADEEGARVLDALSILGARLKELHYYTDTAGFSLRCKVCNTVVKGEKGATKHAESTGHVDFGEV
ncbi:Otu1p [Sugiyamaella lignohabitans]|uniref:Ubiquitin thioesterase OTU n=1 Tax=Sugiyamaella lignohabitans TaxID=796027 RepID=A0A167C9L1_9ASCO|nr:Otu1p [Sugiyamaella lignohabitans]ANB11400.1 Otu1p [Sugiyamaella lignohabitans]